MNQVSSFYVSLSGWSKAREVKILDGHAYFEVAEQGHCSICQGRIRNILGLGLTDLKTAYLHDRYPRDGRTLWAGVPIKADASKEEVIEVLKDRLKLPIL